MDFGVVAVVLFLLPVLQTNLAEEYDNSYWSNYNYTPSGPYFDTSISKNVTLLVGQTANLKCRTLNAENRTISWVRYRDLHLLTVGLQIYTNDQRFQALHNPKLNEWTLQIKFAQIKDTGIYMCQISTTPPTTHFVHLLVTQTSVQILGGPELYISEKGLLNLTCIVEHIDGLPFHIQWTHNNQEINHDAPRTGVSVITEKIEGEIKSYLLIQNVLPSDTGNYGCSPADYISEEIVVYVLRDNPSVAIRNRGQQIVIDPLFKCVVFITIFFQRYLNTLN